MTLRNIVFRLKENTSLKYFKGQFTIAKPPSDDSCPQLDRVALSRVHID